MYNGKEKQKIDGKRVSRRRDGPDHATDADTDLNLDQLQEHQGYLVCALSLFLGPGHL